MCKHERYSSKRKKPDACMWEQKVKLIEVKGRTVGIRSWAHKQNTGRYQPNSTNFSVNRDRFVRLLCSRMIKVIYISTLLTVNI